MKLRDLGPLAAAVGIFSGGTAGAAEPARLPAPVAARAATPAGNQNLADAVAQRLTASGAAQAADVSVSVVDGVVTLTGMARDAATKNQVIQEVRMVPGVAKVRDGLTVSTGVQQVRQDGVPTIPQEGVPSSLPPAVGPLAAPTMMGVMPSIPSAPSSPSMTSMSSGGPVVEPMPLGAGGMGAAEMGAPPLPPNAWPTYAPHNNVSRVGYPTAYPYNAFPFIGPYYPFPKVPLGWRKVTLEWDDGHWWIGKNQTPQDYWRVRFW